jgi:hypothetical protein
MTRLDRMIVAQLGPAVQAFFARLAIVQILLTLLAVLRFAQALQARDYRIAATQSVDLATARAPSRNNHRRTTLGFFLDR